RLGSGAASLARLRAPVGDGSSSRRAVTLCLAPGHNRLRPRTTPPPWPCGAPWLASGRTRRGPASGGPRHRGTRTRERRCTPCVPRSCSACRVRRRSWSRLLDHLHQLVHSVRKAGGELVDRKSVVSG